MAFFDKLNKFFESDGFSDLTTGLNAFGQVQQGFTDARASNLNVGAIGGDINAINGATDLDIAQQRKQGDRVLGKLVSVNAKNGVTFSGSSALVYEDVAREIELDIYKTALNAQTETNRLKQEQNVHRQRAKNSKTSSLFKAGTTLLTLLG